MSRSGPMRVAPGAVIARVRIGEAAVERDEHARVSRIALQCWQGAADQGRWVTKATLPVPTREPATPEALLCEPGRGLPRAA